MKYICWLNIQGGSNMTGTVTGFFTHKSVPIILEPPCIKSVLWRVAKCLSYIEEARCLKVNILLPMLGSPKSSFLSGFPTKTLYTPLLSPIRTTCPAHLILDFITWTILGQEYRSGHTRCIIQPWSWRHYAPSKCCDMSPHRTWMLGCAIVKLSTRIVGLVSRLFSSSLLKHCHDTDGFKFYFCRWWWHKWQLLLV